MSKQMESIKKLKKERRIKRFVVPEELFLAALKGAVRIDTSFPEDSLILSIHHEGVYGGFLVSVMHPSFDKVPEGEWLPEGPTMVYELPPESMKKADKVFQEELAKTKVL